MESTKNYSNNVNKDGSIQFLNCIPIIVKLWKYIHSYFRTNELKTT